MNELIDQAQGLVHSLAAGIARSLPVRADMDDLIAYGELGLAQAARDFDPAIGVAFTTFAYHRIRGAIYDGLAQMTWTSRAQYRRLRHLANGRGGHRPGRPARRRPTGRESLESGVRWLRSVTDQLATVFLTSQADDGRGIRDSAIEDPRVTRRHDRRPAGNQPAAAPADRRAARHRTAADQGPSISKAPRCKSPPRAWESASRGRAASTPRRWAALARSLRAAAERTATRAAGSSSDLRERCYVRGCVKSRSRLPRKILAMASPPTVDFDALLAPISEAEPCGVALKDDPDGGRPFTTP